jgi:PAS domain S-box-containing protein
LNRIPFIHRIGTKIYAALIIVSVFAVALTGAALVTLSGKTLRSNISERNLQIARRASNEISLYIENSINELEATADVVAAVRDPWTQDILLENLAVTYKRFENIHLVDEDGQVLASTLLDRRDRAVFEPEALAAAIGGEIYFSQLRLSAERLPFLTVALPAGVPGGRSQALVAELALRDIWDLVDDISFGEHGQALLISSDGVLIAHPDKTRVITEAGAPSHICNTQSLSSEGSVSVFEANGRTGLLVACAPVKTVQWWVVIQQPLAEAYLPLQTVLLRSSLILAAMVVVALLASLILTRRFAIPLNLLLAGTLRIGRGNLEHRIDLRSKDEIGRLSASFNHMVQDLQSWSMRVRESEERYRLMTESVQDIIFSLDRKGCLLFINRRAETVSGFTRGELLGRRCLEFLSERGKAAAKELLRRNRSRKMEEGLELEVEIETREGARKVLEVTLVEVLDSSLKLQYYGVARDVTQRKEAEQKLLDYQQQLRSLASQLSLAEARERKRIAAGLHDRIAQALAVTRIKLGALKARAGSARQMQNIDETMNLIGQTIREVRTLIFDLSSPLLYEVGLKAALEQLVEQFQDEHGIMIHFSDDDQPKPLTADGSVLLFQAVRELLVNVVKHAGARRIEVIMNRLNDEVRITVHDDGGGFDAARLAFKPGREGGFGLFSLKERLEYMGGSLVVESAPGTGTKACLALVLNHDTIKRGRGRNDENTHPSG